LSWIVQDLWSSLEVGRNEYAALLKNDKLQAFSIINQITYEVGHRYGIVLQLNFPPGHLGPRVQDLGHRNLSILVRRGREKFDPVSEEDVKKVFKQLNPLGFERLNDNQEGFKVHFSDGRIDCLPSGVHLWCEITPNVLQVLDWLFTNAYGLKQLES
jgi:hypothetical protein